MEAAAPLWKPRRAAKTEEASNRRRRDAATDGRADEQ